MGFEKKIRTCQIIVPTLYNGSKEPKEPRDGDIWQNEYTNEINVFVGNKWFKVWNVRETGYSEEEQKEMEQKEAAKINDKLRKLEKIEKVLKDLKSLLDGSVD